ncbi:unnamed protein product, partial [Meganyctiphanes norvegica]
IYYNDVAVNPTSAEKFGKLIATHLDIDELTISDGDVEAQSIILQYADIKEVVINISGSVMPSHLPSLTNVLTNKQCKITIDVIINDQLEQWNNIFARNNQIIVKYCTLNINRTAMPPQLHTLKKILRIKNCPATVPVINDDDVPIWNSGNAPFNKIITDKVVVTKPHGALPFLRNVQTMKINEWCQKYLWRELHNCGPNTSRSNVDTLWTSVDTISALPPTVMFLGLGLLSDITNGVAKDPGISQLTHHCPELQLIHIHIKAGTTKDLPQLPELPHPPYLYISLLEKRHMEWAIKTVKELQPSPR